MSRRAGPARSKAKQPGATPKDDLAKAAAEVLNGINTIGKRIAATAQQAISGGQPRNASDPGVDVEPRQVHQQDDQAPLSGSGPTAAIMDQQQDRDEPSPTRPHEDGAGGSGGTGRRGGQLASSPAGPTYRNHLGPGSAQVRVRHDEQQLQQAGEGLSPTQIPQDHMEDAQQQQQFAGGGEGHKEQDHTPEPVAANGPSEVAPLGSLRAAAAAATAAATAAAATYLRKARLHILPHRSSPAATPACPLSTPAVAAMAATAASLLLLLLLLLLSASGYRLARGVSLAHEALRGDVADLRREALAGTQQVAARLDEAVGGLQGQLSSGQVVHQQLARQVAQLSNGLDAARAELSYLAGELRAVRRAVDASDAVQSIEPGGGGSPAASTDTDASLVSTEAAPAGGTEAEAAPGADAMELRSLPACHVRRVAAAAGPVVPSRVVAHSPVVGDQEALMRLHSTLAHVFRLDRNPRVHPLARQVTVPNTVPACLPLASSPPSDEPAATGGDSGSEAADRAHDAAGGSHDDANDGSGVEAHVELELLAPANVSAISFRYPPYGTWDTRSALLSVSATLHEAPATAATAVAVAAEEGADAPRLRSRHVALPLLRGLECQHVPVPPPPPPAAASAHRGKQAPVLVYGITLHVHRNFGHPGQSCVPRVLVHGWNPQGA